MSDERQAKGSGLGKLAPVTLEPKQSPPKRKGCRTVDDLPVLTFWCGHCSGALLWADTHCLSCGARLDWSELRRPPGLVLTLMKIPDHVLREE